MSRSQSTCVTSGSMALPSASVYSMPLGVRLCELTVLEHHDVARGLDERDDVGGDVGAVLAAADDDGRVFAGDGDHAGLVGADRRPGRRLPRRAPQASRTAAMQVAVPLGVGLLDEVREDLGVGIARGTCGRRAASSSRSSAKFSMMPLWTTAMRPSQLTCGCALAVEGRPWVAQRVWPIPQVESSLYRSSSDSRPATLPTRRITSRRAEPAAPATSSATPAES